MYLPGEKKADIFRGGRDPRGDSGRDGGKVIKMLF